MTVNLIFSVIKHSVTFSNTGSLYIFQPSALAIHRRTNEFDQEASMNTKAFFYLKSRLKAFD